MERDDPDPERVCSDPSREGRAWNGELLVCEGPDAGDCATNLVSGATNPASGEATCAWPARTTDWLVRTTVGALAMRPMIRRKHQPLKTTPMTAKHFAIVAAAAALLTFVADACAVNAATAHAETCIKVDETNSPKATLSGRVVAHHQVPVAWKRDGIHAAATPFLRLDAPLLVDYGTGCQRLPDVALFVAGKPSPRMGQHVTITGTLNRFDSATVVPPVYLDARDAPKPGLLVPSLDHTAASIPEEFLGEWCAAKFENTDIFSRQCPVDGPVNSLSVLSDNFSINVTDCRVRDVKRSGRIYTLNAVWPCGDA